MGIIGIILFGMIFIQNIKADEIVHKFGNPSFSKIGVSAHYLTIESQEFNRKADIIAEIKALKDSEYAANILSQAEYLAGEIKRQVQD